jgi:hypothetical protein
MSTLIEKMEIWIEATASQSHSAGSRQPTCIVDDPTLGNWDILETRSHPEIILERFLYGRGKLWLIITIFRGICLD